MFGPQTSVVDGQRVALPSSYAYAPQGYGPQTTGVPQVSPTMPPYLGAASASSGAALGAYEGVDGYGTAGNNNLVTSISAEHPFNLKVSPTLWAIGFLLGGLLILNGVHWGKVVEEGAAEHAHVGAVSERAEERV